MEDKFTEAEEEMEECFFAGYIFAWDKFTESQDKMAGYFFSWNKDGKWKAEKATEQDNICLRLLVDNGYGCYHSLILAVKYNHVELVKWLVINDGVAGTNLVTLFLKHNSLELMQWYYNTYNENNIGYIAFAAHKKGRADIFKWALGMLTIGDNKVLELYMRQIMKYILKMGNVTMFEHLENQYLLPGIISVFRVIKNGHWNLLELIVKSECRIQMPAQELLTATQIYQSQKILAKSDKIIC